MQNNRVEFDIFGYAWKVQLTEDKEKLLVNGKLCKGSVHYKDSIIYISKDTSEKDKSRILLHELSHAVIYETQIDLKESYSEEDLCEFMAKYGRTIVDLHNEILQQLLK